MALRLVPEGREGYVNLELSPEQHDIATGFEHVLAKESSIGRVRSAEESGFDPELWAVLTEMGAVALAVPESAGGAGSGMLELTLVTEILGRHLACVPLVEAAVAAVLLADAGEKTALEHSLSGRTLTVLCPRTADRGTAVLVPGGTVARGVLAFDRGQLVLANGDPGEALAELGFLACADRRLDGSSIERIVVAGGEEAERLWDVGLGWWYATTAAVLVGIADQALVVAVEYSRTREQFGVAIGSFQVIQHRLADVVMAVEGARLLVHETAWRHDIGDSGWRHAANIAFAHAAETAVRSAEACLHVHGGYGYTLEYDAQLYLRRAKALQLQAGDPEALWQKIGAGMMRGPR